MASQVEQRRGCTDGRRAGFTLVELLVVISIIALLIALLLPALGAAQAVARKTQCVSNMRQWGLAFLMYNEDHGGVPGHLSGSNFALRILPELGYIDATPRSGNPRTDGGMDVAFCPSGFRINEFRGGARAGPRATWFPAGENRIDLQYSYAPTRNVHRQQIGDTGEFVARDLNNEPNASEKMMMGESNGSGTWNLPDRGFHFPHTFDDTTTVLMLDGHVKSMSRYEIWQRSTNGTGVRAHTRHSSSGILWSYADNRLDYGTPDEFYQQTGPHQTGGLNWCYTHSNGNIRGGADDGEPCPRMTTQPASVIAE